MQVYLENEVTVTVKLLTRKQEMNLTFFKSPSFAAFTTLADDFSIKGL